jgi:RNA polymerase sigma-70 factor (ECF subfamily)
VGEVAEDALMRALHEEHAGALWSYALHLTSGDRIRAEDVVQETLLRAWRSTAVLDQSQGSARAWLFTVARRIATAGARRRPGLRW